MKNYRELAEAQHRDAAAARIEAEIGDIERQLRQADEEKARYCGLCAEHEVSEDTPPADLAAAMRKREDAFWSAFFGSGLNFRQSAYRVLCEQVGFDPDKVEKSDVWHAMRAQGHPLVTAPIEEVGTWRGDVSRRAAA